uniref:Uncharacterized protein n=1 Tax=Avena sativa TaxID=4498 RepID=A0ACD5VZN7_AVESA
MQSAPLRPRQSPLLPSQSSLFLATRARKFYIHHFGSGAPLQAIKAEMGSDEDEFTPLSQLTDDTEKCTVRVRISRLWESFHPKNNILFGLDSLLIDDQGETMQARVLPSDIHLFEERLVEGKIYALSDFTVQETREDYMNCSNEWTIYFGSKTVVNEIEGDIDSIPLHSFEFVNFKDLRSRRDNNSLLSDVLGRIVYVGKLYVSKKSRHKKICDATIQNLSLRIQQANPVPEKSSAQKLAESWRTIKQLKGLDPEEYDDDTKFLCRVSLIDIDCTSGWCYPGCIFCNKSLGRKSRCSRCGPVKKPIQM